MDMNSFVVGIRGFFLMDTEREENFDSTKTKYIIPKYQREYKWSSEKVGILISDINNRDKFLGNLILNTVSNYYEIVDGQQRITTIMLILIALFNKNKLPSTTELSEEQRELIRYIFKDETPILANESIGAYIRLDGNEIILTIDEENDIYFQRDNFINLYGTIRDSIDKIDDYISFQKKVLDCKVLVLIGETQGLQNDSIEEIFLDINFKSQLLDVSDIFKGYCFKNYSSTFHDELKEHWTNVRKYTKEFEILGYKDKETCEYIYHYLLSKPDTYNIPANLSNRGKHYLADKNHTQTKRLLLDMGSYGEHIISFTTNLSMSTYIFNDICGNFNQYHTDIINHQTLKEMLKTMIKNTNVQYYKLPLFMFIHYLKGKPALKAAFTYDNLKRFVSNYYAYAFLFINDRKNKNKSAIDKTIFTELYKLDDGIEPNDVIDGVLNATKQLRKDYLNGYKQFDIFSGEKAYALYSLIDNYDASTNYLKSIYGLPNYNKEHLIVHNNSNLNVTWEENNNQFTFSLNQLLGKSTENTFIAKRFRQLTANYLILPVELNELLDTKDITKKVGIIKKYYDDRNNTVPKHVLVFLEHIESMDEYKHLLSFKGQQASQDSIKDAYQKFTNSYFDNDSLRLLYGKLEASLKEAFYNHA